MLVVVSWALASGSTAREATMTTTTSESELCDTELTDESSSSTAASLDSLIWQGKKESSTWY